MITLRQMPSLHLHHTTITTGRCDLLREQVDAIVNPANEGLAHGGGLAAIIARAAGPQLEDESRAHPRVPTGEAGVTTAGDLPQRAVIHAVGPVWHGGDQREPDLLAGAHRSAIALADQRGFGSIAFPAISCGIFGYPVQLAAPVALAATARAVLDHPAVRLVRFCLASEEHERAFADALDALTRQLGPGAGT
jgi:O-acetyl-ADP-ribose deacetylase (regulator of RNase III)